LTEADPYPRPGSLVRIQEVRSRELGNERELLVHLPEGHDTGARRFPVIYMQDGQNLFDPRMSFAGSWGVDEAVHAHGPRGGQAIVVGIPNAGVDRVHEYAPFTDPRVGGGRGEAYLRFLLDEVKPLVDSRFHTLPLRDRTGIAGSSLGGLISLFGFFRHPGAFGFVAALSPSLWFAGGAIFPVIEAAPFVPGRIYIDFGTEESPEALDDLRRLRRILTAKGYREGDTLRVVEDRGATHHEDHWKRRFRNALPFLLNA